MQIKTLSPEETEFKEKDIQQVFEQQVFEHDLSMLEDGLSLWQATSRG